MSEKYYILKIDKIEQYFTFLRDCAASKTLFRIVREIERNGWNGFITEVVISHYLKPDFNKHMKTYSVDKIYLEKAPPELVVAARLRGEI